MRTTRAGAVPVAALVALGALGGCATATPKPSQSTLDAHRAPRPEGAVLVELGGLNSDRGQVLVALFRSSEGFPDQARHAFARGRARIEGGRASVRFEHVPEGAFAIAVHHDEDDDLVMATRLLGIPAEGYGFSRNAQGSFGRPSFEAASLTLNPGALERVQIRLRY